VDGGVSEMVQCSIPASAVSPLAKLQRLISLFVISASGSSIAWTQIPDRVIGMAKPALNLNISKDYIVGMWPNQYIGGLSL